jgi:hypothetical protein
MLSYYIPVKKPLVPGAEAHICNVSYLGGRNPEDHNLRPAQAKISEAPISTNKQV